jgi:hypothetical protein
MQRRNNKSGEVLTAICVGIVVLGVWLGGMTAQNNAVVRARPGGGVDVGVRVYGVKAAVQESPGLAWLGGLTSLAAGFAAKEISDSGKDDGPDTVNYYETVNNNTTVNGDNNKTQTRTTLTKTKGK